MAKLTQIDRRWIFLCVAVALVATLLYPFEQPITPSSDVKATYSGIEELPEGSAVLVATDFDPAAKAELVPITRALLEHCFQEDLRVIGMTFWPKGANLGASLFHEVAAKYNKESGVDYVYLGFKVGPWAQIITNMGEKLTGAFPEDSRGERTANMDIFGDIRNLRDIGYMVEVAAGDTYEAWIIFGGDKYGFPMSVACTAVMGPDMYVFTNTDQLDGIIAGLRGAADYEKLLGEPGAGIAGMPAQSTVHGLIVFFIILGNAVYFWKRRTGSEQ